MNIASYIDHTVLAANTTSEKISTLCKEAIEYHFASVCINSCHVKECAKKLLNTDVSVCTVVGFPLGAMSTKAKAFEAEQAINDGADEIDMVINIGWLKDGKDELVLKDIQAVKQACGDKLLKVIIETCLLTDEEKIKACALAKKAGADFVKTSTGFSTGGATVEDVALMRKTVGEELGVKASGGVHNYEEAKAMIDAGATRIGASCGVAIVTGATSDEQY
ncbi:MAG: deoxyribose-phosphate aldolase [Sphaerochaetaceae bacterium]|nr:deoxyribose-phosphate aldolase [Sphaerochaetaceae bacterium]